MPYLFVGTGQAGSAIVDDIFSHRRIGTIASPLVFNSTIRDLQNLSNIDKSNWYGIAERHGLVDGTVEGFEEKVTGGFGRNPVRANDLMNQHESDLIDEFEERFGEDADVPFVFLFLGLGGGTGCGIAPHIARAIKIFTEDVAEIIAIGVLPNMSGPIAGEDDSISAARQAWNTRYGLNRLEKEVDGIILVDNQRLAYENAAEGRFSDYNEYVASAIVDLVSGPVLERIDPGEYDHIDPPVIDIQDVITALSFDQQGTDSRPGYASIGRSITMTKSLSGYLLPFIGNKDIDTSTLSRLSARKQTLEHLDLNDAHKAIGLIRAPGKYIADEKYRIDTSLFRHFLEERTSKGEVNLGVTLTERNLASFTSLFTFERSDLERLQEIDRVADEYETESRSQPEEVEVAE